jgi:hypothetical protein
MSTTRLKKDSPEENNTHKDKPAMTLNVLAGAAVGAVTELAVFHPVDTATKRIMATPLSSILDSKKSITANLMTFMNLAVRDPKSQKVSFYPGLQYAIPYKIPQRILKFGGQPYVEAYLKDNYFSPADRFWPKALAGACMGTAELVLTPLDILKIRNQTGTHSTSSLTSGMGTTFVRNGLGSFALFGTPEIVHSILFNQRDLTALEKTICYGAGSVAMLVVSNPLDVIKTRVQADPKAGNGLKVGVDILLNNPSQFTRSLGTKMVSQAVKVTFFRLVMDKAVDIAEQYLPSSPGKRG